MREALFQMECGDTIKFIELCRSTAPAELVVGVIVIKIRLVPNFPVFDVPMIAVCPSFVVVADDMLTDDRPLVKVLWRQSSVFLAVMLNAVAEAVENPGSCFQDGLQIFVGNGKIVRVFIIRVRVEIRKNTNDVNAVLTAVFLAVGSIVVARKRNTGTAVIVAVVDAAFRRTVVDGMHALDFSDDGFGVQCDCRHEDSPFLVSITI